MFRMARSGLILVLMSVFGAMSCGSPDQLAITDVTVYLVRHAEKASNDRDPPLTEAGEARAAELAKQMKTAGLTHIHSTNYERTLQTAAPTAKATGLEVEIYDPSDLAGFADVIKAAPGAHLIVGHSNTTPQLVEALGGEPGSEINEASEYDRLYVVEISGDGMVRTELRQYGVRYTGG